MARNEVGQFTSRISAPGAPGHRFISRHLDTSGNGSGTKDASGDYSTPDIFYIRPPAGQRYALERMLITIQDTGSFDATDYGNGVTLTNGIVPRVRRDLDDTPTVLVDFSDGVPIKSNAGWGRLCFDVDVKTWGMGAEVLVARWTFSKSGRVLILDGDLDDAFEILLQDDLSGLDAHYFLVQGYII